MTFPSNFMDGCSAIFDNVGFDRDEIMPLIRQLQTVSGVFDASGESYSTPALELLRRYIAAHWSTFDPAEPDAATSKTEALEWLKQEAARMGMTQVGNIVEAIDLIVRHPANKTRNNRKRSG